MRTDEPAYGDAHCEGVVEVGTRSYVAVGTTRPPHPLTYARWNGSAEEYPVEFDQQLATSVDLIERWHGSHGRRINIALLTPTLRAEHVESMGQANLDEARRQAQVVSAAAREHGVVFTQDGHRKGSVAYAHEMGILGPEALLSHSTGLTEEEIAICAETGTKIAHNPSAIASVFDRCPATELMAAGVVVGLGSDATAPDRSGDMFRHMQQLMHYHRRHHRDPSWIPPGKALEMCTIDGATRAGNGGRHRLDRGRQEGGPSPRRHAPAAPLPGEHACQPRRELRQRQRRAHGDLRRPRPDARPQGADGRRGRGARRRAARDRADDRARRPRAACCRCRTLSGTACRWAEGRLDGVRQCAPRRWAAGPPDRSRTVASP